MNWSSEVSQLGTVLLAAMLGGIIGLEREFARKAAGLRTHVFVSAGSALLVVLSNAIVANIALVDDDKLSADPIRMVQAIVIAISFLGAGTIAHERGREIEGLTTAGSIYITAGIGIAVAVHELVLAVGTVLMTLIILLCIGRIEKQLSHPPVSHQPASSDAPEPSSSEHDSARSIGPRWVDSVKSVSQ